MNSEDGPGPGGTLQREGATPRYTWARLMRFRDRKDSSDSGKTLTESRREKEEAL